ncbi:MAG: hypothetical protein QM645_07920 [Asticcacaulis sp.]
MMKRHILVTALLAAGLSLGTLAPVQAAAPVTHVEIEKPATGTTILIVTPEVSLGILTASGMTEPRAEWSKAATGYFSDSLKKALGAREYATHEIHLDTYEDPRALQMLKLNDEVISAIMGNTYYKLPTKTTFDWTLGESAQVLVPAELAGTVTAPRYALFLRAKGSYQSSAKAALNVGMALLRGPMQFGGQAVQATLVDLSTGQVVWYELDAVPTGEDIREPEGAAKVIERLFKKLPL